MKAIINTSKILTLYFISIFIGIHMLAQTTTSNALAFPSTNNAFLGKNSSSDNVSVDLYTGTAQVNIPICNLNSRQLNIPISIDYVDGKGIKVQEYASQVGLGWQLNAGGNISRVVRGFPDEQTNGYLGTQQWGLIVANAIRTDLTSTLPLGTNVGTNAFYSGNDVKLSGQTWAAPSIVQSSSIPTADGEPDIFYVKTPFFNFQFSFDENGHPVFSNAIGYQVISTNFINTPSPTFSNSSFEVIDTKGNQFYFGSNAQAVEVSTDTLYNVRYTFPTTWYLSKIVTYNGQDIVNFNYQAAVTNDTTYNYNWDEISNGTMQNILSTGQTIVANPKYISSIVSLLGEVDFNYIFGRKDDPNVPYLASVVKKSYDVQLSLYDQPLQTFNFSYNYFGSPSTNKNLLRLQLNGITLAGNTSSTSTPKEFASFTYNTTVSLPDRTQIIGDYWGYPNVANSSPDLGSKIVTSGLLPDATMAQAGILKSITTQLGGTWNLAYELNSYPTYSYSNSTTSIGGLRITQISKTLPTGENLYKNYQYVDVSNHPSGQLFSQQYFNNSFNIGSATVYYWTSPYVASDINGTFIGYSFVKEIDQNGGYTIYNFSNFSDPGCADLNDFSTQSGLPILTTTTSLAYKRGLLKNKTVYNANGNMISQVTNIYSSITNPIVDGAFGFRPIVISVAATGFGGGAYASAGIYSTQIENYRLSKTVQNNYDQVTPSNYIQTITNYSYSTSNNRLLRSIATTDSKQLTNTQTFYYPDDQDIVPMSNPAEYTASSSLITSNNVDVITHQITNRNGIIHQVHNTYSINQTSNVYLTSKSIYTGSTLEQQQSFYYDPLTSNMVTVNDKGNKPTAILYGGYNSCYPVAQINNASALSAFNSTQSSQSASITTYPSSTSFNTNCGGSMTLYVSFSNFPGNTGTTQIAYTLSGPVTKSGVFCFSLGTTPCNSLTTTLSNMPAGNYTLSASMPTNTNLGGVIYTLNCSYQIGSANEYFYEGFEEGLIAVMANAHTGYSYSSASSYTVPFTPPNSRSYLIQWWNLSNSKWIFNEKPYSTNMVLTGPVDDIRVFPADALITTYTYSSLVGKTSQIDPSGRTQTYLYDGLGRIETVRDDDGNIVKEYQYGIQVPLTPIYNTATTVMISPNINNCGGVNYPVGSISYTVPANKYSSYSQSDLNQQVQNDINTLGQAYANSHVVCSVQPSITGVTNFTTNSNNTTVSGTISATPGQTVMVNINLNIGGSIGASIVITIPGYVLNSGGGSSANLNVTGQMSIPIVMPSSGTVNWSATITMPLAQRGGAGGGVEGTGSITVK